MKQKMKISFSIVNNNLIMYFRSTVNHTNYVKHLSVELHAHQKIRNV